jgi:hypothetical protein
MTLAYTSPPTDDSGVTIALTDGSCVTTATD